jgi:hypothetical protein
VGNAGHSNETDSDALVYAGAWILLDQLNSLTLNVEVDG